MNMTCALKQMMYKQLDGANTIHPYDFLYAYKLQRLIDARDNLEKRKRFLQRQRQQEVSPDDGDMDDPMTEVAMDGGEMLHSTKLTADDSGVANSTVLSHTPQPSQPNSSLLSGNIDISNVPNVTRHNDKDKASGSESIEFDWNGFMAKAKLNGETGTFAREWQKIYDTPSQGQKDVVSMDAAFALLEQYHQRRHEELVEEGIDSEVLSVVERVDRVSKEIIWKKDVKKRTINNIMTVMADTDTINTVFNENPEFLTKAFGVMANANVLQKLQKTNGFKPEWLTNMELAIANNKKSNATNAVAEEGMMSQLASDKNNKDHDAEDMPLGQIRKKPGGYKGKKQHK